MNPYRRTVLSAALDWHAINALANQPPPMDLQEAQAVIAIAYELHRDAVKVRCAAWRAFTRTGAAGQVLLLFLETSRPLKLAELMIKEMENERRKERKRRAA